MSYSSRHLLLVLALGSCAFQAPAAEPQAPERVTTTVLVQSDHSWDGSTYGPYPTGQPELTVLKLSIPAHTALPWHTHPVPNAGYVVSGTLHLETRDGGHARVLHAGEALPETVGIVHRGWTEDSPVELVVFYAGSKGTPTSVKAP